MQKSVLIFTTTANIKQLWFKRNHVEFNTI